MSWRVADRRVLACLVVGGAAVLRLSGLGWDDWHHQHPDERFLVMVAERLSLPQGIGAALDPARTPANPNNRGFDFYVYGAFPPLVNAVVAGVFGARSYAGLLVVGRLLAVAVDLIAVVLVIALAARLGGAAAGLLAGALYGACPLLIQQARFATTDVWGIAGVLAVAWAVVGRPLTPRALAGAGVALGVAAACKPNLVLAALLPLAAVVVDALRRSRASSARRSLALAAGSLAIVAASALATIKLADPGAFAATASVLPNPRRLAALQQLASFGAGQGQYPPNLQWADRRAVLEPLANLLIWGTGPALGVLVLLGLAAQLRRAALGATAWLPILAFVIPVGAWHLSTLVCSVRYFEPLLPFGIAAAAVWLARRRRRRALVALVVIAVAAWGTAWAAMAWRPYTRVEASAWLRDNLPAGAVITAEYWDDALPLPGGGRPDISVVEIPVFAPDTPEKREHILRTLARADAVVLASQRGVGSICRVPDAYPLTSEYYRSLFSGALGFEPVAAFQRRLVWGRFSLSDLAAEESLSVYDHPPVWIFLKTGAYRDELARALLERVAIPAPIGWSTAELEARGTPPYLERWRDSGRLPGSWRPGAVGQAVHGLLFLTAIELAGLLGARLLRRAARDLPDGGWGVARWLGLAAVGVVWLFCGWAALPGWNAWLPRIALLAALPWGIAEARRAWRERAYRVTAALVWATFAVFLLVRACSPEVYWGEKPMDASLLAGIWRADRLPPVDPWFSGSPLNYYFFGFLPFAAIGKACGIPLGVAFNLAVAAVPALTAGCAVSLGWLLSGRAWAGALAVALAQLVGTAGVLFHPGLLARPEFNGFWATSRVIGTTINEYPVWTALFADLHAHFLGFPGFLAGVLVASALALRRLAPRPGAVLAGAIVGVEAMTNTWELPVLVCLLAIAALVAPVAAHRVRALVRAARFMGSAALVAVVVALPYWLVVRQPAGRVVWTREATPPLAAFVELFGIPALLALVAAVSTLRAGARGRAIAWGWGLVAMGVALIVAPDVVTIADRMNTVFKLHLQAHLLLGAALAGLIAATAPALPRGWRVATGALIAVALAIGTATSVSAARAVMATRRVPGPRPTLDGAAYLARLAAGRAAVLAALAKAPADGTVVETSGPPYSDSLRVPMFTGLPALVGWEYHLWQRDHAAAEIRLRQHDLAYLLGGEDEGLLAALAKRYRVAVACSWNGVEPAVARLTGWRVEPLEDGAILVRAPSGGPR